MGVDAGPPAPAPAAAAPVGGRADEDEDGDSETMEGSADEEVIPDTPTGTDEETYFEPAPEGAGVPALPAAAAAAPRPNAPAPPQVGCSPQPRRMQPPFWSK